jgi:hypothetical protein
MNPFEPKIKRHLEKDVQEDIMKMLRQRGWYVVATHGNAYQMGFPDLYATHVKYGARWIEVKLPEMRGSKFTVAQLDMFPKLVANGTPIWILTGASEEEYAKLFHQRKGNLSEYLLLKTLLGDRKAWK